MGPCKRVRSIPESAHGWKGDVPRNRAEAGEEPEYHKRKKYQAEIANEEF